MKEHTYEPLSDEHIRVITLHPSEDTSSPLSCSIHPIKLDDNVKVYECISDAWGEPTFSHHLNCGDGSTFKITPSLYSALTRFRDKQRPRLLWVDAVCIYQRDLVEKSQQIPLMDRIFHAASRILVWLGDGDKEKCDTIEWLSRVTRFSSIVHEHTGNSDALKSRLDSLFIDAWPRIVHLRLMY
jgi:heterokaryon incompatibility protein (HET)